MSHDRRAGCCPWSIEIAPLMPMLLDDLALVAIAPIIAEFSATGIFFWAPQSRRWPRA